MKKLKENVDSEKFGYVYCKCNMLNNILGHISKESNSVYFGDENASNYLCIKSSSKIW